MNCYVTKQLRTAIIILFELRPRKATQKQQRQQQRRGLQYILEMLAENKSKHIGDLRITSVSIRQTYEIHLSSRGLCSPEHAQVLQTFAQLPHHQSLM